MKEKGFRKEINDYLFTDILRQMALRQKQIGKNLN